MKTLNQAIEELKNYRHDIYFQDDNLISITYRHNIYFQDDNLVSITRDEKVVVSAEMHDVNNESEVVEFIEAFLDGSIDKIGTKKVIKDRVLENTKNNNKTCLTCKHRQRWQCNSKIIQYCGARKSKRTENGLLKIRCKDIACILYKNEKE